MKKNHYLTKIIPYIKNNKNKFIKDAILAHKRFNFVYGSETNKSPTQLFRYYNLTNLTFGSIYFFNLYKELQKIIRKFSNHNKPLWYQSWLNFHSSNEVLDWHKHHHSCFHGYISIDPKDTETEFENYKIKNEVGKVYIGSSGLKHRVNLLKPYEGKRITIAFDVFTEKEVKIMYKKYGNIDVNTGLTPIYL